MNSQLSYKHFSIQIFFQYCFVASKNLVNIAPIFQILIQGTIVDNAELMLTDIYSELFFKMTCLGLESTNFSVCSICRVLLVLERL